jgi:chaperone BCS1
MLRTASAKESADREAALLKLADEFASQLTEVHFSTAQLQAFLMSHRRDPVSAVAKVGKWLAEQQAAVDREEKEQD